MGYSGVTTIKGEKFIWLQGIGYVKAKLIESFEVGDKIAYNYGSTYTIISKTKATPKFWELKVKSDDSGDVYTQRVKVGTYKPYLKR